MAKKQQKKRNKKYKQSYKSERQDYRQGGRVQKAVGGIPRPIDDKRKEQPMSIGGCGGGNQEDVFNDLRNQSNEQFRGQTRQNPNLPGVTPPPSQPPMSIGGVGGGEIQTAMDLSAAQERQAAEREIGFRGQDTREREPIINIPGDSQDKGPKIGDTKKGSGLFGKFITYVWDGNNWVVQQKEDKETITEDEFAGMTEEQKKDLFESERGTRAIQTGRTAEQIAAGKIPEGIVPTAEVEKISMEGTEAPTVELEPTEEAVATTLAPEAPEEVALGEAK